MRRTSKTIRRLPPRSRQMARMANELDRQSRQMHKLAESMAQYEQEHEANDGRRVKMPGCSEHPKGWELGCDGCFQVWATTAKGT